MRPHLTVEQRQLALRLHAEGLSLREIGPQVGCAYQTVALIARRGSRRPVRLDGWVPSRAAITVNDSPACTPRVISSRSARVSRPGPGTQPSRRTGRREPRAATRATV